MRNRTTLKGDSTRLLLLSLLLWPVVNLVTLLAVVQPGGEGLMVVAAELIMKQPMPTVALVSSPNYLSHHHRLVMLGDVHGDIENLMENLRQAQVVDIEGHWVSSKDTVVQVGDVVDRGPHGHEVLEFFQKLKEEAAAAGGEFIHLLGNHEVMNLKGDTRFVNPKMIQAFGGVNQYKSAWAPTGPYGAYIASLDSLVIRNQTLLVHAGLLPSVAKYAGGDIQKLNKEMKQNIQDKKFDAPLLMENGPVWTRAVTRGALKGECALLMETLRIVSEFEVSQGRPRVLRMVVGHTIQPLGLVQVLCNEHFIALDIAMSQYFVGGGWLGFVELRSRAGRPRMAKQLFGRDGAATNLSSQQHAEVWSKQQQMGDRQPSQEQWEEYLHDTEDYLAVDNTWVNPDNFGPLVRYPPDRDKKHVFQKIKQPNFKNAKRYLTKPGQIEPPGIFLVEDAFTHNHGAAASELGPFSYIGLFMVGASLCWGLTVIAPCIRQQCCPSQGSSSGRKKYPQSDEESATPEAGGPGGLGVGGPDAGGDHEAVRRRKFQGVL